MNEKKKIKFKWRERKIVSDKGQGDNTSKQRNFPRSQISNRAKRSNYKINDDNYWPNGLFFSTQLFFLFTLSLAERSGKPISYCLVKWRDILAFYDNQKESERRIFLFPEQKNVEEEKRKRIRRRANVKWKKLYM